VEDGGADAPVAERERPSMAAARESCGLKEMAPLRPPSSAVTSAWRRRVSSGVIIGSHWNGVKGLGTKVLAPRLMAAEPFPGGSARRAAERQRFASRAMATTSSSRSSGRPIMK